MYAPQPAPAHIVPQMGYNASNNSQARILQNQPIQYNNIQMRVPQPQPFANPMAMMNPMGGMGFNPMMGMQAQQSFNPFNPFNNGFNSGFSSGFSGFGMW